MKILVDTNIVLDVFLAREPFVHNALTLFDWIEKGKIEGFITATTVTNIFYILRKAKGREQAIEVIKRLLLGFGLCDVNQTVIEYALNLNFKDFEDGVQVGCAVVSELDGIVTRNIADFSGTDLPVFSVSQLIERLKGG